MPRTLEELKGCPAKRPETNEEILRYRLERVRAARRKALEWQRMKETRAAFNRDQWLASQLGE